MHDEPNPWTTHASKVEYDNPWIRVTEHQVTNPGGHPGIYGVVHYKHHGTGVIALDEAQHIWLVGQYRYPLDVYSWEIPEGGGALEVDPLVSAQRELKEEVGLTARHWQPLVTLQLANCITDQIAYVYLARDLTLGEPEPDPDEQLKIRRLPFTEAYGMVLRGELTDSMTVAGILRLHILMQEGDVA